MVIIIIIIIIIVVVVVVVVSTILCSIQNKGSPPFLDLGITLNFGLLSASCSYRKAFCQKSVY